MRMKIQRILFCLLPPLCEAFVAHPSSVLSSVVGRRGYSGVVASRSDGTVLFMSNEDENAAPKRRRRKRKEAIEETEMNADASENENVVEELIDLKPRATAPMKLEVQDIMGLAGGGSSVQAPAEPIESPSAPSPVASGGSLETKSDPTYSAVPEDSFAQLLEDARRMKSERESDSSDDGEESIKAKARSILSTIVTADFFLVCGFLLWFLAGIGFRAVFNNDSVQIAFNNNFELLVQPSLGVLMLGTIAGNYLKDEDE